jgi:hypothetical protein
MAAGLRALTGCCRPGAVQSAHRLRCTLPEPPPSRTSVAGRSYHLRPAVSGAALRASLASRLGSRGGATRAFERLASLVAAATSGGGGGATAAAASAAAASAASGPRRPAAASCSAALAAAAGSGSAASGRQRGSSSPAPCCGAAGLARGGVGAAWLPGARASSAERIEAASASSMPSAPKSKSPSLPSRSSSEDAPPAGAAAGAAAAHACFAPRCCFCCFGCCWCACCSGCCACCCPAAWTPRSRVSSDAASPACDARRRPARAAGAAAAAGASGSRLAARVRRAGVAAAAASASGSRLDARVRRAGPSTAAAAASDGSWLAARVRRVLRGAVCGCGCCWPASAPAGSPSARAGRGGQREHARVVRLPTGRRRRTPRPGAAADSARAHAAHAPTGPLTWFEREPLPRGGALRDGLQLWVRGGAGGGRRRRARARPAARRHGLLRLGRGRRQPPARAPGHHLGLAAVREAAPGAVERPLPRARGGGALPGVRGGASGARGNHLSSAAGAPGPLGAGKGSAPPHRPRPPCRGAAPPPAQPRGRRPERAQRARLSRPLSWPPLL